MGMASKTSSRMQEDVFIFYRQTAAVSWIRFFCSVRGDGNCWRKKQEEQAEVFHPADHDKDLDCPEFTSFVRLVLELSRTVDFPYSRYKMKMERHLYIAAAMRRNASLKTGFRLLEEQ